MVATVGLYSIIADLFQLLFVNKKNFNIFESYSHKHKNPIYLENCHHSLVVSVGCQYSVYSEEGFKTLSNMICINETVIHLCQITGILRRAAQDVLNFFLLVSCFCCY